jgi:cobalt-zinc-cadmium efflux system protein
MDDLHAHGDHQHTHDPAPHGHADPAPGRTRRALIVALLLTGSFAAVEAIGGYVAGSLALLSDAGHMLTDAASLGLALFAHRIAQRPPSARASYGYARAEVLAAFINALAMLLIVGAIVFEAVRRLVAPEPVRGGMVLVIAVIGLGVNIVCALLLSRAKGSVNARAALLHVMGDLLGSVAAIAAGAVILLTGWMPIDPILSIVVSLLILRSTWQLLRQTTGVLMEAVPAHLDFEAIGSALAGLPGVRGVHDLHVWAMGTGAVALSAHVGLTDGARWHVTLAAAQRMLRERYQITHVTLQPDWPRPAPVRRNVIPVVPRGEDPPARLH